MKMTLYEFECKVSGKSSVHLCSFLIISLSNIMSKQHQCLPSDSVWGVTAETLPLALLLWENALLWVIWIYIRSLIYHGNFSLPSPSGSYWQQF